MVKKIAVINDLSGLGRCSLVAAISVLASMGLQPCPLPTAVLSAQTGFPSFYLDDYTEKMEYFRREWEKLHQQFQGIYTGYVSDVTQIHQIFRFLDTFKREETFLVVDPVLGDDGEPYPMTTDLLLEEMRKLVLRADVITPNLTEFCLLTGKDLKKLGSLPLEDLAEELITIGRIHFKKHQKVIVTGISYQDETGVLQVGNLYFDGEESYFSHGPKIGGSYSGTGDLFTSILTGGIANNRSVPEIMEMAGEFLQTSLKASINEDAYSPEGVNYEPYLYLLR